MSTAAPISLPSSPVTDRPLNEEIAFFRGDCETRYNFNSRWDNMLNIAGILLSVAIIASGVYQRSDIATILGGFVAALVTAQRAFPFGQRAMFYRVLIGKARNLQTEVEHGMLTIPAAVTVLETLRIDYAQQLPVGTSLQAVSPAGGK